MSADQDNHWDELAADLTGKPIADKKTEDSNAEDGDSNAEDTASDGAQEDAAPELDQAGEESVEETASDSDHQENYESEKDVADIANVVGEDRGSENVGEDEIDDQADGETPGPDADSTSEESQE